MKQDGPFLNSEATEAVFGKYGGASGWLMESSFNYEPPEQELASYAAICEVLVIHNDQHRILTGSERNYALAMTEEGLMFGLYVLAYNFMILREDIAQAQIDLVINYYGEQAQKYIHDRMKADELNEEPDTDAEHTNVLEGRETIMGLRNIVDSHIDELCPDIDRQIDFRHGVLTAEAMFAKAIDLNRGLINKEFEKIMSNSEISFDV